MVTPRAARPTLRFVDEYCERFADLFPEVRSLEAFKYLHIGMISDLKRKTLPAIAKVVGLENEQGLHHLLTKSPWSAQRLRKRRLDLILELIQGKFMILLIDETGDCKKGTSTDYVKRLIIQPLICFNWLKPWLKVFPIPSLQIGFEQFTHQMNGCICPLVHRLNLQLIFSSA